MKTGICIICFVVGLLAGVTYSKALIIALKSEEKCEGIFG
jgi:hypothetical protein